MSSTVEVRAPIEQSEGTRSQVQRWLKSIGDTVVENEPLIEVETDKVTIEIPSPVSGVLREIVKHETEAIAPGDLLGTIEPPGASTVDVEALVKETSQQCLSSVANRDAARDAISEYASVLSDGRTSPAVRRLLAEHHLQAADVTGTGAGGRITVDDVLAHVKRHRASASPASESVTTSERVIPHSSIRKRIAERMVESLLHTAPHVTTVFEVDLGAVLAHRAQHRADFESRGASLTLTAYFIAACADAVRAVPEANSRWTDEALLIPNAIDIGVGTAIEGRGLVVPVVRNVASLDLFEISRRLAELVRRARGDQLTPAEVRGGTFTISNHGVSGSLLAAPIIINQPQSAILGVGKVEKRAVIVTEDGTDSIVIRPRCYVTLTVDHRVMDGERANRFLNVLVDRLEGWQDE